MSPVRFISLFLTSVFILAGAWGICPEGPLCHYAQSLQNNCLAPLLSQHMDEITELRADTEGNQNFKVFHSARNRLEKNGYRSSLTPLMEEFFYGSQMPAPSYDIVPLGLEMESYLYVNDTMQDLNTSKDDKMRSLWEKLLALISRQIKRDYAFVEDVKIDGSMIEFRTSLTFADHQAGNVLTQMRDQIREIARKFPNMIRTTRQILETQERKNLYTDLELLEFTQILSQSKVRLKPSNYHINFTQFHRQFKPWQGLAYFAYFFQNRVIAPEGKYDPIRSTANINPETLLNEFEGMSSFDYNEDEYDGSRPHYNLNYRGNIQILSSVQLPHGEIESEQISKESWQNALDQVVKFKILNKSRAQLSRLINSTLQNTPEDLDVNATASYLAFLSTLTTWYQKQPDLGNITVFDTISGSRQYPWAALVSQRQLSEALELSVKKGPDYPVMAGKSLREMLKDLFSTDSFVEEFLKHHGTLRQLAFWYEFCSEKSKGKNIGHFSTSTQIIPARRDADKQNVAFILPHYKNITVDKAKIKENVFVVRANSTTLGFGFPRNKSEMEILRGLFAALDKGYLDSYFKRSSNPSPQGRLKHFQKWQEKLLETLLEEAA